MEKQYGFKNKRLPDGCLKKIHELTGFPKMQLSGWLGGSRKLYANIDDELIKRFKEDLGVKTTKKDWKNLPKVREAITKWYYNLKS